jgi:hypothetical protein
MSTEDDLKILKKYARRCNQQNKLLQKLVLGISQVVLPAQEIESFDFDNVTDEIVDDFVTRFTNSVDASARLQLASVGIATKDERVKDLEKTTISLEQQLREKHETISSLQKTVNDLRNELDAIKAKEEVDDSWSEDRFFAPKIPAPRSEVGSAPLRSINELMGSGISAPLLNVDVAGSVDDFMAMLEGVSSNGSLGRISPKEEAVLITPPAEDAVQQSSEISELFDSLDFDSNLRKEMELVPGAPLNATGSEEEKEEAIPPFPSAPPFELLYDSRPSDNEARPLRDSSIHASIPAAQDEVRSGAEREVSSPERDSVNMPSVHAASVSLNPFDEPVASNAVGTISSDANQSNVEHVVASDAAATVFPPNDVDREQAPSDPKDETAADHSGRGKHRERFSSVGSSDHGDTVSPRYFV